MRDFNTCSFCNEFQNIKDNNFYYKYLENKLMSANLASRIIAETKNFIVMPMVGPLVEGYLLLVPKTHYLSFAHLPLDMLLEAECTVDLIRELLNKFYGQSIVYEHGPLNQCFKGGCCSDHAHLHIVAIDCEIYDKFSLYNLKPRKMNSFLEIQSQLLRNKAYLYYQDHARENFIIDVDIIESQFIRKLLAKEINALNNAYWETDLQIDWIVSIINKLKPEIAKMNSKFIKIR